MRREECLDRKRGNMRREVHASLFHLPLHSCHISSVCIVFYFLLCHSLFFCLSSSIIISCHCSLSPSPTTSLLLSLSCLGKKRQSRNKAINKKSTAFSVPPHYRLLMYAFCSSITHRPQINALIFPPARLISVAVTTARGSCRTDLCTVGRLTYILAMWCYMGTAARVD